MVELPSVPALVANSQCVYERPRYCVNNISLAEIVKMFVSHWLHSNSFRANCNESAYSSRRAPINLPEQPNNIITS